MSLVQSTMFSNHISSSNGCRSHHRSKSFELMKVNSTRSKRSYSDDDYTLNQSKRCKTAPPSPPYDSSNQEISRNIINRSRSLSPSKKFINPLSPSNSPKSSPITSPKLSKVKLPSITAALNSAPITEAPIKLKPITPDFTTISKDDHWRYELLNRITKQSRHFHLNQYNYLNKNDSTILLPRIHNYTYEVEQYPEYLELAQSLISLSKPVPQPPILTHKFVPITTPKKTAKSESSPKNTHHHTPRVCLSCGSDQSPCWRPSWSIKEGQLCNSCGLRYKKTSARCLNDKCRKIPAKGEWSLMQSKGTVTFEDGHKGHSCLECGWRVEVK